MEYFYILKFFLNPFVIIPSIILGIMLSMLSFYLLKKERTDLLIKDGLRMSKWFLVGGEESNFYYDIDKKSRTFEGMEKIAEWYVDNINEIKNKEHIDALAFIEREDGPIGAITKKDLISFRTNIPSLVVRPKKRIRTAMIKGSDSSLENKKLLIISDVATTGRSIGKVLEIIKSFKGEVVGAITILNRGGSETEKFFKDQGLLFKFAAKKDDLQGYVH